MKVMIARLEEIQEARVWEPVIGSGDDFSDWFPVKNAVSLNPPFGDKWEWKNEDKRAWTQFLKKAKLKQASSISTRAMKFFVPKDKTAGSEVDWAVVIVKDRAPQIRTFDGGPLSAAVVSKLMNAAK